MFFKKVCSKNKKNLDQIYATLCSDKSILKKLSMYVLSIFLKFSLTIYHHVYFFYFNSSKNMI